MQPVFLWMHTTNPVDLYLNIHPFICFVSICTSMIFSIHFPGCINSSIFYPSFHVSIHSSIILSVPFIQHFIHPFPFSYPPIFYLSIFPFIYPSAYFSSIYPSILQSFYVFIQPISRLCFHLSSILFISFPSIHSFIHQSTHPLIFLSSINFLSIHLSIYPSIWFLFINKSIHLFIYLFSHSVNLPTHPFIFLSVTFPYASIHQYSTHLSIYPSLILHLNFMFPFI